LFGVRIGDGLVRRLILRGRSRRSGGLRFVIFGIFGFLGCGWGSGRGRALFCHRFRHGLGGIANRAGVLKQTQLFDGAVVGTLVEGLVAGVAFEFGEDGGVIGSERVAAGFVI